MADQKPLTKTDLPAALKDFRQEVNRDLASLRQQIRDDAFEDRTEFYSKMTKPEMDKLRQEMIAGFKDVDVRLGRVEMELHWVKDEIKGLKEEFSTTPSRGEFNRLKARVDKFHPAN